MQAQVFFSSAKSVLRLLRSSHAGFGLVCAHINPASTGRQIGRHEAPCAFHLKYPNWGVFVLQISTLQEPPLADPPSRSISAGTNLVVLVGDLSTAYSFSGGPANYQFYLCSVAYVTLTAPFLSFPAASLMAFRLQRNGTRLPLGRRGLRPGLAPSLSNSL
jgi:hypothetical protein